MARYVDGSSDGFSAMARYDDGSSGGLPQVRVMTMTVLKVFTRAPYYNDNKAVIVMIIKSI
jgi:hypothetical protein